jgi:mRNA interferase MazF
MRFSRLISAQKSVVLSDQVKSLDWRVRQAKKKDAEPEEVLQDVRAKIKALLQIGCLLCFASSIRTEK